MILSLASLFRSVSKTSSIDGQSVESGDAAELNKQRNGPQEEVEACRLMKEILLKDPLFDAVPGTAHPPCPSNVVRFRFTGAGAYGIPPSLVRPVQALLHRPSPD